jgi:N6-adenosine-specific RNA methylase IME4
MLHLNSSPQEGPRLNLRAVAGLDFIPLPGPLFPEDQWLFSPLDRRAYHVIVADPPWQFRAWSRKGVTQKSAGGHYQTMKIDEIAALPVGELGDPRGALLLMWATAPMMPAQIDVMRSWGFPYISQVVWRKVWPSGKLKMATGYRVRCCHEVVLVGRRGKVPRARTVRSVFDGVARNKLKGEESQHSRKPAEFWSHFAPIYPGATRWCELFSRSTATLPDGTCVDAWGDQMGKFDAEGERSGE